MMAAYKKKTGTDVTNFAVQGHDSALVALGLPEGDFHVAAAQLRPAAFFVGLGQVHPFATQSADKPGRPGGADGSSPTEDQCPC